MRVAAAFLCDAATIREGLLNVLGAGVTNLRRESFPAPLGISLVYMAEAIGADDLSQPHTLTIDVRAVDDQQVIAHVEASWVADLASETDVTVPNYAPIVVPFDQVALAKPGYYEVTIDLKGVDTRTITFRADLLSAT
jgi:hypothetical protein